MGKFSGQRGFEVVLTSDRVKERLVREGSFIAIMRRVITGSSLIHRCTSNYKLVFKNPFKSSMRAKRKKKKIENKGAVNGSSDSGFDVRPGLLIIFT